MTEWWKDDIDPEGSSRGVIPQPLETTDEGLPSFGQDDIDPYKGNVVDVPKGAPWHSIFTGEGRTASPDMPELRGSTANLEPSSSPYWKLFSGMMSTANDQQLADIATKVLPGATQRKDTQGDLVVNYDGRDFYVNKPGVSRTDLMRVLGSFAMFAPAGKLAAAPSTLTKRIGVGVPANMASSILQDKLAQIQGSKQPIDWTAAAVTGAAGAAGEVVMPLARQVKRIGPAMARAFHRNQWIDDAGQLTDKGQRAARAAGLDPATMDDIIQRQFAEEAAESTGNLGPRMRGKEFNIPLTRGQAFQDFDQLAKEDAIRHGAKGAEATDIMRAFDARQQEAMQAGRAKVHTRLGGGDTRIARPTQAGDFIQEGVAGRAAAKRAAIEAAYEAAKEHPAKITTKGFKGLTLYARERLTDFDLDPDLMPATVRGLRNLRKMEKVVIKAGEKGRITSVALRRLETERKKLGKIIGLAKSPTDKSGATNVKAGFDEWLDDVLDAKLFEGDEEALKYLKAARRQRTEFGRLFEVRSAKDDAGKVIQNILAEERTPEQVMNYVLGRGALGNKVGAANVVKRIKDIVGEGSEEMLSLKEAAWLKLSKEMGQDGFSPQKFSTRFNKVMDENYSLMTEIFDDKELALIRRFQEEVQLTIAPPMNPSKTAYTGARLIREWLGRIGTMFVFSGSPVGGATFFTLKRMPEVMGKRFAKKSIKPVMTPRAKMPLFTTKAAIAGKLYQSDANLEESSQE